MAAPHRRTVARCAGKVWEMELSLPPLPAVERLRCVGERGHRSRRDDGRERALRDRQHDGSRPCLGSGRKRGIHQRALGRSRGGFTSKIHCLGDARGRPIAFDLTPGEAADCKSYESGRQEPSSPTRHMIPMRSATTSSSATFAPSSRRNRTAPRRSATTSGFIVSAIASSGCSAISRSTAPSPHDMINSPIASSECYISQPRVTGSNLSTRPSDFHFCLPKRSAYSVCSPPPCGEGLGVGVHQRITARPPPRRFAPTLPTRGRVGPSSPLERRSETMKMP
jgi:hypothetical protein